MSTSSGSLRAGRISPCWEIASLRWSEDEVKALHRRFSREMKAEMAEIRSWERMRPAA